MGNVKQFHLQRACVSVPHSLGAATISSESLPFGFVCLFAELLFMSVTFPLPPKVLAICLRLFATLLGFMIQFVFYYMILAGSPR